MSEVAVSEVAVHESGAVETRQERAVRRATLLRSAFQSVFETLADIYRDEDWKFINDLAGRPYTGFTAFVAEQLGCAASNARRYQQGIVGLVLPLQELAMEGARIPVTSADVARLGIAGARVVIEEAPSLLQGIEDPDEQTAVLRELIDSVAKRSTVPGFGPVRESALTESPLGALVPAVMPELPGGSDRGPVFDEHSADAAPPWDDSSPTDSREGTEFEETAQSERSSAESGSEHPMPVPPRSSEISFGSEEVPERVPAVSVGALASLEAAIGAVLATDDPAALAEQVPRGAGATWAVDCMAAAQRLARLGQLLRSLAA